MSVRVPKDSLRENLVMAADEIIRLRERNEQLKAALTAPWLLINADKARAAERAPLARLGRWLRRWVG